MENYIQTKLTGADLIEYALTVTPEEKVPQIEELWRTATLPDLQEILSYPALCLSNELSYRVVPSGQGYRVVLDTPQGEYDTETDLIQWTVTGRGTLRHPTYASRVTACGTDTTHYAHATMRHCARPSCPACAHYHISKDTPDQSQKIYAKSKDLKHTEGWRAGYLQHITVSVPENLYYMALTPDGFTKLKKWAIKYAQSVGVKGGYMVFHPFRQNGINDDDILPEDYTPTETNDLNKHSARFSPHFHIVGFGFITGTEKLFNQTGWIIKALRVGDKKITSVPEISGVLSYLKSHAGIIDEKSPYQPSRYQSGVWFGVLAPNQFPLVGFVRMYTPQICPECGAPLKAHHVHGPNGDTSLLGDMEIVTDYPIFATRSNTDTLRAYLEENKGAPADILQHLDRNPLIGCCSLSNHQLTGMLSPLSVKCLDGSLHCIQSEAIIKVHYPRSRRKKPPTPPQISEASEISRSDVSHDHPPAPSVLPSFQWGGIDYHLPPGVDTEGI